MEQSSKDTWYGATIGWGEFEEYPSPTQDPGKILLRFSDHEILGFARNGMFLVRSTREAAAIPVEDFRSDGVLFSDPEREKFDPNPIMREFLNVGLTGSIVEGREEREERWKEIQSIGKKIFKASLFNTEMKQVYVDYAKLKQEDSFALEHHRRMLKSSGFFGTRFAALQLVKSLLWHDSSSACMTQLTRLPDDLSELIGLMKAECPDGADSKALYGTSIAAVVYDDMPGMINCNFLGYGSARAYVLDEKGLRQVSRAAAPLTAQTDPADAVWNQKQYHQTPCLFFCVDGEFRSMFMKGEEEESFSPLLMEGFLLSAIAESPSYADLENAIKQKCQDILGDEECGITVCSPGFADYAAVQEFAKKRLAAMESDFAAALVEDYLVPGGLSDIEARIEEETENQKDLWQQVFDEEKAVRETCLKMMFAAGKYDAEKYRFTIGRIEENICDFMNVKKKSQQRVEEGNLRIKIGRARSACDNDQHVIDLLEDCRKKLPEFPPLLDKLKKTCWDNSNGAREKLQEETEELIQSMNEVLGYLETLKKSSAEAVEQYRVWAKKNMQQAEKAEKKPKELFFDWVLDIPENTVFESMTIKEAGQELQKAVLQFRDLLKQYYEANAETVIEKVLEAYERGESAVSPSNADALKQAKDGIQKLKEAQNQLHVARRRHFADIK